MFALSPEVPIRPFAISRGSQLAPFAAAGVRTVDVLDPGSAPFCLAMNRANCLAYDGTLTPGPGQRALGMPLWVFLDCCVLPSVMVGYEVPRDALPADIADGLDPDAQLDWIGVSEYVALPSLTPGEVVGVSLFSLVSGSRLGLRAKALALRVLEAKTQLGIAQLTNAALGMHLRFGALEIVAAGVRVHSRPDETFIYRVQVPAAAALLALEQDGAGALDRVSPTRFVNPHDAAQRAELARDGVGWAIVDVARDGTTVNRVGLARVG
jgi:hypothetical protein